MTSCHKLPKAQIFHDSGVNVGHSFTLGVIGVERVLVIVAKVFSALLFLVDSTQFRENPTRNDRVMVEIEHML